MPMKYWLGITFSAALLVLFVFTANPGKMLDALRQANYWYLPPAVLVYLASVYFRSMRWTVMLRHMKRIGTLRLYPVVVIGYMANNLLPMRLGELVRSYYAGEREGINKTAALATIFSERVFDALTLLAFIAALAPFMPLDDLARSLEARIRVPWWMIAAAFSAPFVGAFIVFALSAAYPDKTRAAAAWLARPLPERARRFIDSAMEQALRGLSPLRNPATLGTLFILSIPIWLAEAGVFYLMGFAFGIDQSHSSAWAMMATMTMVAAMTNVGASVPLAPGGVGMFEFVSRETLVLGPFAVVSRSTAAAHAIITHAVTTLPMIALGQAFLWMNHLSLRRLRQSMGEAREPTAKPQPTDDRQAAGRRD